MNPATTNKTEFKAYLKSVGIAPASASSYQSALNSKITAAIREFCHVDLGIVYAVADTRLLTFWLSVLKDNKEFNVINNEGHGTAYAAFKKYIEYVKHLSKQPKQALILNT